MLRFLRLLLCAWLVLPAASHAQATGGDALANAARAQVGVTLTYDPAYVRLAYPGGDVPAERGVCSDVVVRAFRTGAKIDLQQRLHEDMRANFAKYPALWGLRRPDTNIDHRRVPNLRRYFERQGKSLPVSAQAKDYRAGDIVSWTLPNGLAHIGVVSARTSASDPARPLVVHNIGAGAQEEDVLFAWTQTGHYRWFAGEPAQ